MMVLRSSTALLVAPFPSPQLTQPHAHPPDMRRLCCLCGTSIHPNPSNMCVNCIRSQVDITEGLQKQVRTREGGGRVAWLVLAPPLKPALFLPQCTCTPSMPLPSTMHNLPCNPVMLLSYPPTLASPLR